MTDETKKCPFCAESIKADAIICRYCGRDLISTISQIAPTPGQTNQGRMKNKSNIVVILLAAIILLCVMIWAIASVNKKNSYVPYTDSSPSTVYAKDFVQTTKEDWDCNHDSIGNVVFEGKVRNVSNDYDLRFVELRATVYSSSGEVINTNTGYIDSDILYAASTSTFTLYVDDPDEVGTKCKVDVEDASFK